MVYLKWILLMPLSLLMAIVGRILAPILPFFVQDDGYLPNWLWWFQTPDNPCDGDRGHWKRHPGTDKWSTYKRRVAWFMRNVAYGFDESVCGVHMLETDRLVEEGNKEAGDKTGISGVCNRWLYRGDKLIAFHYYKVRHYTLLGRPVCVRVSLGWKLWNPECFDKQYTAYWNPIKGFEF